MLQLIQCCTNILTIALCPSAILFNFYFSFFFFYFKRQSIEFQVNHNCFRLKFIDNNQRFVALRRANIIFTRGLSDKPREVNNLKMLSPENLVNVMFNICWKIYTPYYMRHSNAEFIVTSSGDCLKSCNKFYA